jgi:hypothetical protein
MTPKTLSVVSHIAEIPLGYISEISRISHVMSQRYSWDLQRHLWDFSEMSLCPKKWSLRCLMRYCEEILRGISGDIQDLSKTSYDCLRGRHHIIKINFWWPLENKDYILNVTILIITTSELLQKIGMEGVDGIFYMLKIIYWTSHNYPSETSLRHTRWSRYSRLWWDISETFIAVWDRKLVFVFCLFVSCLSWGRK